MPQYRQVLANGFYAAATLAALAIIVRPSSPVWAPIQQWRDGIVLRKQITEHWPLLTSGGERLDVSGTDVQLVVFSDYQCPYCRRLNAALDTLTRTRPDIGVVLRHWPIRSIHPYADYAARISICSRDLPADDRRRINDHLYDVDWTALREDEIPLPAGVQHDPGQLRRCLRSAETDSRLALDGNLAHSLGVASTPTLFIRNRRLRGALSAAELGNLVQ